MEPGARWVAPAVLLLHLLALLLLWRQVVAPAAGVRNATRLALIATPLAEREPPTLRPARPGPAAPAAARSRRPAAATPIGATPASPAVEAVTAPDEAASEPLLLDPAATLRAVRDAARQPGLAERAREEQGTVPRSTGAALGDNIGKAAHGDCAKGEYAGAGMGLLSLPFWAAAELRGKCAR
jgi:hypothetical protein